MADPETPLDADRLHAAATWRARLTDAGLHGSPEFDAWLAAHPANGAAWGQVQGLWGAIGSVAAEPEMLAARRDALDRARRAARRRWRGEGVSRRALAAGVGALAAAAGTAWWLSVRPTVFQTGVGERRSVTLGDGSRLALDAGTRVEVALTRDERRLVLHSGQARFDVAHDSSRPFSVAAGDRTVLATGTSFNIELLGGEVQVSLLEGSVSVFRGDMASAPSPTRLSPGQKLVAATGRPDARSAVVAVSADKVTAWESGSLVFDDEPLTVVAERINRYARTPVVIGSPEVGRLRISGVFEAGDTATFLDTLTSYLPLEASRREDGAVVLLARS